MGNIRIIKADITTLDTDAITNAANRWLRAGSGVCGAIFQVAGMDKMTEACEEIGMCPTGEAAITPGFNLKAKYVIHAVGPIYEDGNHDEELNLYNVYQNSLKLAVENGCKSIAFPLISAGIYGYPQNEAWQVAIKSCKDFLAKNGSPLDITFAVIDDRILAMGLSLL